MKPHEVTVTFDGAKVAKLRQARGISITRAAAHLGISERTYRKLEKGGDPRGTEIAAICEMLEIPFAKMHTLFIEA